MIGSGRTQIIGRAMIGIGIITYAHWVFQHISVVNSHTYNMDGRPYMYMHSMELQLAKGMSR